MLESQVERARKQSIREICLAIEEKPYLLVQAENEAAFGFGIRMNMDLWL